jgi:hypothetical protein
LNACTPMTCTKADISVNRTHGGDY